MSLEKIVLVKIPTEIYPTLYETFVYLFEKAGIKNIQIAKKVDFEKLYDEDPVEAARMEHKMRKKNEQLQQVQQQTQQLQMENIEKFQAIKFRSYYIIIFFNAVLHTIKHYIKGF